jgi:hypothetical protein
MQPTTRARVIDNTQSQIFITRRGFFEMDYEPVLEAFKFKATRARSDLLHVQLEGIESKLFETISKGSERDCGFALYESFGRVNAQGYSYVLDVEVAAARLASRSVDRFYDGRGSLVVRVEGGVKARV